MRVIDYLPMKNAPQAVVVDLQGVPLRGVHSPAGIWKGPGR